MRRWVVLLIVLAVLCFGAALAAGWGSASLQQEANDFSVAATAGDDPAIGGQMTEEQYRYMDLLYTRGQALFELIAPLLIGAMAATFATIAVLAVGRSATRHAAAAQAEATAAS